MCLVEVAASRKNWLSPKHFTKNTPKYISDIRFNFELLVYLPSTPHVNSTCITSKLKKQFWGTIPSSYNKSSIVSFSLASTFPRLRRWLVIRSCESKVGNLKDTFVADE